MSLPQPTSKPEHKGKTVEAVCTHERRPGTTVCLRCRHDARLAARTKFRRLAWRSAAVGIVVLIVGVAVSASAIRGRANARERSARKAAADSARDSSASVSPGAAAASGSATVVSQAKPADAPVQPTAPLPPLVPALPMGASVLSDSVTASRTDSAVVVSFDAPMLRTRRPEKLEQLVRATLPLVYGGDAAALLAKIPNGGLAAQAGDNLADSVRAFRIPVNAEWVMRVTPETRPGQEGPLVVRYRVVVVPASQR